MPEDLDGFQKSARAISSCKNIKQEQILPAS